MSWRFYVLDRSPAVSALPADSDYSCEVWRPSGRKVKPAGFPAWPFSVWWLFHQLHIFSNREYGLVIIRKGDTIIHRSCIFPRYFRFPFMSREDLQVGDTWTAPGYRGLGLGTLGLRTAATFCSNSPRKLWYLVEESNPGSIRVAENVGFKCAGWGSRTAPLGIRLFGRFVIERPLATPMMDFAPRS